MTNPQTYVIDGGDVSVEAVLKDLLAMSNSGITPTSTHEIFNVD